MSSFNLSGIFKEQNFRERCNKAQGVVEWRDDGVLLECVKVRSSPSEGKTIYFNEITNDDEMRETEYLSQHDNYKNRIIRYLHDVYPLTSVMKWVKMNIEQLITLTESFEVIYRLPLDYIPNISIKYPEMSNHQFYRIPKDVHLGQLPNRPPYPNNTWVEVIHFGPLDIKYSKFRQEYFSGTYYYHATGSGVYLYLGKTLQALNKVNALKTLGASNSDIYTKSGYSLKMWVDLHQKSNPGKDFNGALNDIIEKMNQGTNFAYLNNQPRYFGLGDKGDPFLANLALKKGYNTIQLIKEAQQTDTNHINIGFEIIDLQLPIKSQAKLMVGKYIDYTSPPPPPS